LCSHNVVSKRRHRGTIAALDLVVADEGYTAQIGQELKARYIKNGFLIRPLGNVLYLLPPFYISQKELLSAWNEIADSLEELSD